MLTDKPVRVRFAPSPTGYLHIGGARTALFNWLFARHHNGAFILRIEDTDQKRYTEDAIEKLMADLRWLGLQWDEGPEVGGNYGPYIQSDRLDIYQHWAHWLVEQGKAYKDYSTAEELKQAREAAEKTGQRGAGYERRHRFLSDEERTRYASERGSYVIRIAIPLEGQIEVQDRIRGKLTFNFAELSDTVLLKSDGFPTYHLAMAVDDHLMEISHVMRSDEWLPSAGLHQYLYDAFGWEAPEWVHLPVMLNPNGKGKMSKRKPPVDEKGNVIPVMVGDYREGGYIPEAIVNFLANTGWSFGEDREIFTVAETIERFTLDRLSPAATAFPVQKLYWLNGVYIREMGDEQLAEAVQPYLEQAYGQADLATLVKIAPHIKERTNPLTQAVEMLKFLFGYEAAAPEEIIQKKMDAASTRELLQKSYDRLTGLSDFSVASQEAVLRPLVEESGLKPGQVFGAIRSAVTGQQVSPPLFESMEVLGQAQTLARLKDAIERLEKVAV